MNRERILPSTWIMLIILFLSLISIGYQIVLKNVVVDIFNIRASWVASTITSTDINALEYSSIDWTQQYPFPINPSYVQIKESDMEESSESGLNKIYSQFESYSTDWFFLCDQCEIISKLLSRSLGMNLLYYYNGGLIFRGTDGRFLAESAYGDTSEIAYNIISFANYLESKNIQLLYVAIPAPTDPEEPLVLEGMYKQYENQMTDELLDQLTEAGVNILDLRQQMKEENISWTDAFFDADHHWRPSTGFWAAKQIADEINSLCGGKTSEVVFDKSNYNIETIDNAYLGSLAQLLTSVYAEKETMEIWRPKFDTSFHKLVPEYGVDIWGDFEEVMYDMTRFPDYRMWNHSISGLKKYDNQSKEANSIKLMLMTDSYSDFVSPFLACDYREITEIDRRLFNGSLETLVEAEEPDIVVIQYGVNFLNELNETAYNMHYFG